MAERSKAAKFSQRFLWDNKTLSAPIFNSGCAHIRTCFFCVCTFHSIFKLDTSLFPGFFPNFLE